MSQSYCYQPGMVIYFPQSNACAVINHVKVTGKELPRDSKDYTLTVTECVNLETCQFVDIPERDDGARPASAEEKRRYFDALYSMHQRRDIHDMRFDGIVRLAAENNIILCTDRKRNVTLYYIKDGISSELATVPDLEVYDALNDAIKMIKEGGEDAH